MPREGREGGPEWSKRPGRKASNLRSKNERMLESFERYRYENDTVRPFFGLNLGPSRFFSPKAVTNEPQPRGAIPTRSTTPTHYALNAFACNVNPSRVRADPFPRIKGAPLNIRATMHRNRHAACRLPSRRSSLALRAVSPRSSSRASQQDTTLLDFVQFAVARRIQFSQVRPQNQNGGRGIFATFPVKEGDTLIAVPRDVALMVRPNEPSPCKDLDDGAWAGAGCHAHGLVCNISTSHALPRVSLTLVLQARGEACSQTRRGAVVAVGAVRTSAAPAASGPARHVVG